MSAEQIFEKWRQYIEKYENNLQIKKDQLSIIINKSEQEISYNEKANARKAYEMQNAHFKELQTKLAYLEFYYNEHGELPENVAFGEAGRIGAFLYKTSVDSDVYSGYARNVGPGLVTVQAQHFNLVTNGNEGKWKAYSGDRIDWFGIEVAESYPWLWYNIEDQNGYMSSSSSSGSWTLGTFFGVAVTTTIGEDIITQGTTAGSHWFKNGIIIEMPRGTTPIETPWDYYNEDLLPNIPINPIFPNKYSPISSPYPLTLWSIKETKDDKFIAGTFPYDEEDAGGGTFYAMIRPVLKYENIGRDENGNINIGNLSLTFEDVVRKSAWQDDYKIVSFNWNDVNSADYSTYVYDESNPELAPNTKEIDLIETYELSPSINQRIPLQDNRIKSGFYKGQLISYYNEARPSFTIKVMVEWQGYPYENPWQGTAKIILSYKNDEGEIVKKPINLDLSQNKQTIIFNIRTVDKEGKLIEYNITEEIDGEDNYWDTTIINQSIKYKQTGSVCKIKNFWVKDPYDSDHPLSVPVQFKTFNYTLKNNINAGQYKKYFSSNDNFISYIESQDGFIDWQKSIVDLMSGGVRENEIKIFCADYVWYQPSIGPTYRFFPYMSIIKKDARGNIRWYHFKIKAFTNVSPNPFAYDMDKRTVEVNGEIRIISSFLITCPYCPYNIVDRNASYYLGTSTIYYESQSGTVSGLSYSYRNLGHCPENQFYKKGCITPDPYEYEITNPPYDWEDDKDIYYFEPNEDYQKFYVGVPLELPIQSQFTGIRATVIISNTAFSKDSDNNTTLKNFRIYIVDNLCLDTDNIEDGIPYYYEITIDDTQESTLKAELKFNEKSQNFIVPKNDDPYYDPNLGPEQEVYSKHLLSDYDENKKFIIKQNNLITPNKENIINAYENDEDDFTKIYKVLYGGE